MGAIQRLTIAFQRLLLALLVFGLVGVGCLMLFFGLVRLGWRTHGAPIYDLGFLHLEWVLRPDLPQWEAHISNLSFLALGLLLIAVANTAAFLMSKRHLVVKLLMPPLITLQVLYAATFGSLILLAASFVLLMVVTNLEAVQWCEVSRRTILIAAGLSALAALAVMVLLFGRDSGISELRAWSFVAVQFAFAGPIIAVLLACLIRIARHLYRRWRPYTAG